MKKAIILIALLMGISACSSEKKANTNKVEMISKGYDPILDQNAQVIRLTSMIKSNDKLNTEQKNKLVDLIKEQSDKVTKIRKEQSQLRATLVDQMLQSSDGSNSATLATAKKLEEINKKNIKGLNDFILKFRNISGEQEVRNNQFMREVGSINFI